MTIIYQYKVATTSFLGFFALLRRWRGSVYKLIYTDAAVFSTLYAIISLIYRYALNDYQKQIFSAIAKYCNSYTSLIPVSFVLGFYVTVVVNRWWQQFSNVPWPDRTLYILGSYLVGLDEHGRILRRTVARYMLFAWILILRSVSVSVMKRYPTLQHIVDAGYITYEESILYEKVECKYNKFWVPLVWANGILTMARKEGRIESEVGFRLILEYIADYRDKCSLCFVYDWITIPLVYTQVVTVAVYTFFGACLIGRQFVDNGNMDLYVPFFTLLQFFFYMGWLKVAEQMLNPFGEDDDDYDMNWLLDRHTAVAMCLVDQCHANYPPLVKDAHFNEIEPELPYTEAAMSSRRPNFMGSTYNIPRPSLVNQQIRPSRLYGDETGYIHKSESKVRFRTGSKWSLFGFKPSASRTSLANSRENIGFSTTLVDKQDGYGPTDTNENLQSELKENTSGLVGSGSLTSSNSELPPEYVPLKHLRGHKKRKIDDEQPKIHRWGRKWSFPPGILRKKHTQQAEARRGVSVAALTSQITQDVNRSPNLTSRFKVESVAEKSESRFEEDMPDETSIQAGVYRPAVLSAIEENTDQSFEGLIATDVSKHTDQTTETSSVKKKPRKSAMKTSRPVTDKRNMDVDEQVKHAIESRILEDITRIQATKTEENKSQVSLDTTGHSLQRSQNTTGFNLQGVLQNDESAANTESRNAQNFPGSSRHDLHGPREYGQVEHGFSDTKRQSPQDSSVTRRSNQVEFPSIKDDSPKPPRVRITRSLIS